MTKWIEIDSPDAPSLQKFEVHDQEMVTDFRDYIGSIIARYANEPNDRIQFSPVDTLIFEHKLSIPGELGAVRWEIGRGDGIYDIYLLAVTNWTPHLVSRDIDLKNLGDALMDALRSVTHVENWFDLTKPTIRRETLLTMRRDIGRPIAANAKAKAILDQATSTLWDATADERWFQPPKDEATLLYYVKVWRDESNGKWGDR
jgi:hypothetical protein